MHRVHDTTCRVMLLEPVAARITNSCLIENQQGISVDSASRGLEISRNTVVNSSGEGYGSCLTTIRILFPSKITSD